MDRTVMDWGFKLMQRDPTGLVVLVEIDTKSLKQLNGWPLPYRYHADVINKLVNAGAWRIAFDVDLSSRTNTEEHPVLEKAIKRADGRVVLPVFTQQTVSRSGRVITTYSEPPRRLRRGASLAITNIDIDEDGRVRKYAGFETWRGRRVPTLGARLAGKGRDAPDEFLIDFGIREEGLTRLSYIDVLLGRFDAEIFKRKIVIVGATAPKVGDRIPVPAYGVVMGPTLHALAYESLAQDRGLAVGGPWFTVVVALILSLALKTFYTRASWSVGALAAISSVPVCMAIAIGIQAIFPYRVDTTPWWIIALLSYAFHAIRLADRHSLFLAAQRNLAIQRRAMLNNVVEDSFDGIVIVNDLGTIQLSNPMTDRLLGLNRDNVVSRPLSAVIPELDRMLQDVVAGAIGEITNREVRIERQNGTHFIAEVALTVSELKETSHETGPQRDQNVFIFTFRDITERKRTEEAERTAMEQAIAASRAKSEFLANVSHELRTPLNAIIGFSEMLNGEMFGPLGAEQYKDYVTDIHNSGTHLLEVINDILDMSKIEAGEMSLQEQDVDVAKVVRSSVRLIGERAKNAGLTVAEHIPKDLPRLNADARLVKQIMLNLLSNAVKFTPEGGKVSVEVSLARDGSLKLAVTDTGIGIASEDIEPALTPFGQVDTGLHRKYEGTGLGLPLVKSMVDLHGGTVEIQSVVDKGTTVIVTFNPDRTVRPPAKKPQRKKKRALAG